MFDEVIIATGHWQDSKFQKHNAHLDSVWPSQNFKTKLNQLILEKYSHESDSVSESETFRILVHGTSLSAIDAIKSIIFDEGFIDLQADGSLNCVKPEYTVRREDGGKVKVGLSIDLVSRNGFLSKVRGKYGDYQNQYLTRENVEEIIKNKSGFIELSDVFNLLKMDIKSAYEEAGIESSIESLLQTDRNPFSQLKHDLDKAINGDCPDGELIWQTVYHQSSDLFLEIYKHLSPKDKLLYESFVKTLHFVHIAPMPKESAEELLMFHENNLLSIKPIGKGAVYHIREDGKPELIYEDGSSDYYDLFVVAIGQDGKAKNNQSTLFRKLFQEGNITTQTELILREEDLPSSLTEKDFAGQSIISKSTTDTEDGWLYDTGQILRSENFSPINRNGEKLERIKIIGVASSAFGLSRFSRAFEEGFSAGKEIILSQERFNTSQEEFMKDSTQGKVIAVTSASALVTTNLFRS